MVQSSGGPPHTYSTLGLPIDVPLSTPNGLGAFDPLQTLRRPANIRLALPSPKARCGRRPPAVVMAAASIIGVAVAAAAIVAAIVVAAGSSRGYSRRLSARRNSRRHSRSSWRTSGGRSSWKTRFWRASSPGPAHPRRGLPDWWEMTLRRDPSLLRWRIVGWDTGPNGRARSPTSTATTPRPRRAISSAMSAMRPRAGLGPSI
jgi:hypothetical protein